MRHFGLRNVNIPPRSVSFVPQNPRQKPVNQDQNGYLVRKSKNARKSYLSDYTGKRDSRRLISISKNPGLGKMSVKEFCPLVASSPPRRNKDHGVYTKNANVVKTPFGSFFGDDNSSKSKSQEMLKDREIFGEIDQNCINLTERIPKLKGKSPGEGREELKRVKSISTHRFNSRKCMREPSNGVTKRKQIKRNDSLKIAKRLSGYNSTKNNSTRNTSIAFEVGIAKSIRKKGELSYPHKTIQADKKKKSKKMSPWSSIRENSRNSSTKNLTRKDSLNKSNPLMRRISTKRCCKSRPPKVETSESNEVTELNKQIKGLKQKIKMIDEDVAIINHSNITSVADYKIFKKFARARKSKIRKLSSKYQKLLCINVELKRELQIMYKHQRKKDRRAKKFQNSRNMELEGLDIELMKNKKLRKDFKNLEKKLRRELSKRVKVMEERTEKQIENEKSGLRDYYGYNSKVVKRELKSYIKMLSERRFGSMVF